MYHLCAYQGSAAIGAVQATVPAAPDSIFKIGAQNGFVLQQDMMLLAAFAGGVGIKHAGLKSPKLNQFNPLQIVPDQVTIPVTTGLVHARWPYRPVVFRNQEEVVAIADNTNAAAQQTDILAWFCNQIEPVPPGELLSIRGTSTTAAAANAWTILAVALDQVLPEGVYTMIASEHFSANAVGHRFTFWNQFFRPGMLSNTTPEGVQMPEVKDLTFGAMGQFSNVTLPNMEVFCSAADASHVFLWHCIKTA